ncbi:U11/U12 small nuclear ribonucleoprotein 48 kDa protein, partial [Opisthocomus hoazin]
DKDLQFHILKQARAQSAKEGGSYSEVQIRKVLVQVPSPVMRKSCMLGLLCFYVSDLLLKHQTCIPACANVLLVTICFTSNFLLDDSQKGPKSHLEILAEMRDYKRRRQSYRAKNVHITKKSYTEVIRDVIGVHMEELSHHWQEESKLDNAEICEGGKPKSSGRREDRRSASVDSRQSGGSCKDTERARHRRESSRSPNKRKRSRERGKDRDSRRKRERDEDKYHSHKRRK